MGGESLGLGDLVSGGQAVRPHVHHRGRLSTPSCSVCDCGAIAIFYPHDPDRLEWLETSWEPGPVPPPPRSERPTTPLPLVRAEELARAGWDVRP